MEGFLHPPPPAAVCLSVCAALVHCSVVLFNQQNWGPHSARAHLQISFVTPAPFAADCDNGKRETECCHHSSKAVFTCDEADKSSTGKFAMSEI